MYSGHAIPVPPFPGERCDQFSNWRLQTTSVISKLQKTHDTTTYAHQVALSVGIFARFRTNKNKRKKCSRHDVSYGPVTQYQTDKNRGQSIPRPITHRALFNNDKAAEKNPLIWHWTKSITDGSLNSHSRLSHHLARRHFFSWQKSGNSFNYLNFRQ